MSVYAHKKSSIWHYDFQLKGRRFHGSTGAASRAAAERVEADEREKAVATLAIEARERKAGKRQAAPMTLKDVVSRYWDEVASRHARSDQVLWSLDWLTNYFGDDKPVCDIDSAEISRMVAKRRGEGVLNVAAERGRRKRKAPPKPAKPLSAARVNRSVTEPLRKVLYFARDTLGQHIQPVKWKQHLLREPEDRIRVMKTEQETAILAALPEKYHALVFVKKRIGARIFELLKMKWSDLDWSGPRVEIEGKGGSRATVPLPKDVRDVLWAIPRRGEYIFTHDDGSRFTYSGVDTAWGRACEKAGVTDLHLHDLRHTAATNLLKTTNLKVVQKLLRHRDIRSTLRYAHADDADLLDALEASAPLKSPEPQSTPAKLRAAVRRRK